jgi:hypothetical protein
MKWLLKMLGLHHDYFRYLEEGKDDAGFITEKPSSSMKEDSLEN